VVELYEEEVYGEEFVSLCMRDWDGIEMSGRLTDTRDGVMGSLLGEMEIERMRRG
jgi:hypothetical protein